MMIGEIEGKNAKKYLRIFSWCKLWLATCIVVNILCVPFGIFEMLYYQSCISGLGFIIFSPIFPGFVMLLMYEQMRRAPARIKLYSDKIVFEYQLGKRIKEKTMFWGNITELVPYDVIKDETGQEIRLPLLYPKDMDFILKTAEESEYLDIEYIWEIRNLDKALKVPRREPNKSMVVSKRAWSSLIFILFYGVLFIPLAVLLGYVLIRKIKEGDHSDLGILIPFFLLFGLGSLLVPWGILDSLRHKEFHIDRKGARMRKGKKIKYDIKWKDISMVYNWQGRYNRDMGFLLKSGKRKGVSNNDFDTKEIIKAYNLAKEYCAYHRIPMDNKLGW